MTFLHDHVASIAFSKSDNTAFGDAEIQGMLDANQGLSSWDAPESEKKPSADGKPEVSW